ncbi:hypothetical protein P3T73_03605 [Kiritimatiellota bacterium B12222]|nr:hypothetical protein P3T73_03605 [Kiritimatiellota bacterium B12222]
MELRNLGYANGVAPVHLPSAKSMLVKYSRLRDDLCMPQSLSHVMIHTVFSTKNRQPFLKDLARRNQTFAYLGATVNTLGCQAIMVGGVLGSCAYFQHPRSVYFPSGICERSEAVEFDLV